MTRKNKANYIIKTLEELYPNPPIPLDHSSPYTLLIAVLLSAQTTDKKVNEITPALFRTADTPYLMEKLDVSQIKELIKQIGLSNTKAKNIHKLSQIIVNQYNGIVPANFKDLESLPGVGHKTASVVMSQAFGHPAFPVDTHIHRLMWRWGLSTGKNVEQTERDAKKIFPKSLWNKLHIQIIYYGREYSPARGMNLEHDIITRNIGRKSILKNPSLKIS